MAQENREKWLWIGIAGILVGFVFGIMIVSTSVALMPSTNTIYYSPIHIAPSHNQPVCTQDSCTNYTQAGNFTYQTSLNATGYIEITSSSTANLTIEVWESYPPSIPQNAQYYNQFLHEMVPNTYTSSFLNASTKSVVIPVLPGNLTFKAYNFNPYDYYGTLNITYVVYK
jgi:hypothetical protein